MTLASTNVQSGRYANLGAGIGFRHRSAFKLLTATNGKTPKGEDLGYFTATLYLMPHTSGGGVTLCPHSTPACREMCLAGSGLSALPRAMGAKQKRTDLFHNDRTRFLKLIYADIERLVVIAGREGVRAALRLNGTSDILWERVAPEIFDRWPQLVVYDYTKIPIEHRHAPPNYDLTYSVEGEQDMERAVKYLRAGHSIAVVVPEDVKDRLMGSTIILNDEADARFIDGDLHDLRFLDPPSSIVLLKPKGHVRTSLMRPRIVEELSLALRVRA